MGDFMNINDLQLLKNIYVQIQNGQLQQKINAVSSDPNLINSIINGTLALGIFAMGTYMFCDLLSIGSLNKKRKNDNDNPVVVRKFVGNGYVKSIK